MAKKKATPWVRTVLRIYPDVYKQVRKKAVQEKISINALINRTLAADLSLNKKEQSEKSE